MDLMSVTATYAELEKKYNGFVSPELEIQVGSRKLISGEKLQIGELELELTNGFEASGCTFLVIGAYEPKLTDYISETDVLQLGETVEVSLGYVRLESVFKGYINRIEYRYGSDGSGFDIYVECMDLKGLLMKTRRMEFFTQKSADAVVSAVLGETPASSYLAGKELDRCPEEEVPLRSHMMSDYDLIVEQASKNGFEFFVLQGKVYFRKRRKVTSPIMKLVPGKGLLNARFTISGQELVKRIEVRSIDASSGKQISGEASPAGTYGSGSGPKKMMGDSHQVYYEPGVKDAAEAKLRAQTRLDAGLARFGQMDCECIGIPELAPGRYVELDQLSSRMNRKYYVTCVRHVVDRSGYRTYLKAEVDSL